MNLIMIDWQTMASSTQRGNPHKAQYLKEVRFQYMELCGPVTRSLAAMAKDVSEFK